MAISQFTCWSLPVRSWLAAAGLEPGGHYVLALSAHPLQPTDVELLERFTANAAGGAIVKAVGPIRRVVQGDADASR